MPKTKRRRKTRVPKVTTREGVGGQKWLLIASYGNGQDADDKADEFADAGFITQVSKNSNGQDWDVWVRKADNKAMTTRQADMLVGVIGVAAVSAIALSVAGAI